MKKAKETTIRKKLPKKLRFSRFFLRRTLPFLLAAAVIDVRALINLRKNTICGETDNGQWWAERVDYYFTPQNGESESEAETIVKKNGIPELVSRLTNSMVPSSGVPSPYSEMSVMLVRPEKFEYVISGPLVTLLTGRYESGQENQIMQHYLALPEEAEQIETEMIAYGKKHILGTYFVNNASSDPIISVLESVSEKLNLGKVIRFKGPAFESHEPLQAYLNDKDETFCGLKYAWVNDHADTSRLVYSHDAAPDAGSRLLTNQFYNEQKNGQYRYNREARDQFFSERPADGTEFINSFLPLGYPANCRAGNHMREIAAYMDDSMPSFKERAQTLKTIIEDESGTLRSNYDRGDYEEPAVNGRGDDVQLSETELPSPEERLETIYSRIGHLPEETHDLFGVNYDPPVRAFCTYDYCRTNQVKLNGETCYLFLYTFSDNLMCALPHLVFMNLQILILAVLIALIWGAIAYYRMAHRYEMEEYRRSLTAALAHDLKSPLTAISGYAENLSSGVHPEKQAHYSDSILEGTQYMDNIITNVLDLARLEQNTRAKKQKIELIALLKEINANRQDEIESRKLNVEITGSCTVRADPLMMMQALRNLLDNAVKFTPDGGSITVTGEGSTLRISNDIAEEKAANVEQLCEAFVKGDSARSNRKGTGLGLSVVRQIAELNRLQFSLESSGHRFNVILRGKKGLRH